jgi:hypothetical protein
MSCLFRGIQDDPRDTSTKLYTCIHGLKLKWKAARRALGLPATSEVSTVTPEYTWPEKEEGDDKTRTTLR